MCQAKVAAARAAADEVTALPADVALRVARCLTLGDGKPLMLKEESASPQKEWTAQLVGNFTILAVIGSAPFAVCAAVARLALIAAMECLV